jgi:hypothetical protein
MDNPSPLIASLSSVILETSLSESSVKGPVAIASSLGIIEQMTGFFTSTAHVNPKDVRNAGRPLLPSTVSAACYKESLSANLDKARSYEGQPHTTFGERGSNKVVGLTYRDISDCILRGLVKASHPGVINDIAFADEYGDASPGLNYNHMYELDLEEIDPMAMIQNAMVEIEKMMGTYPNVPALIQTVHLSDEDAEQDSQEAVNPETEIESDDTVTEEPVDSTEFEDEGRDELNENMLDRIASPGEESEPPYHEIDENDQPYG